MVTKTKSLKTPLRYPGGKSRAITKMSQFFPDMKEYTHFREPFLGGGSVALWVTKQFPNVLIWVNDLYEPLYNFWSQLQQHGHWIEHTLKILKTDHPNPTHARRLFEESKKYVSDKDVDPVWRAVYFYVVNKCSFSGLTESSSFSAQASESNFSMNGIIKLSEYSKLIETWKITNYSYEELLKGNGSFVYLDPPYEISSHLYGKKGDMHKFFDHDQFAKHCENCKQDLLVSYNSSQLIKDRFSNWKASEYDHTYTMRSTATYTKAQKDRKELVLFNYDLN
tara:strand:- start:9 stop:848 length:840 start_codon:yes stop_codon:yes gene_type:complete